MAFFALNKWHGVFAPQYYKFSQRLCLEGIAPQVFEAIYQRQQGEILWVTVLWMITGLVPTSRYFQLWWPQYEVPPHFQRVRR